MKYSAMEMKCDTCHKTIKGQSEVYYNMTVDQDKNVTFEWICDSCLEKFIKSWDIKELISYKSDGYIGGSVFTVKMADGRIVNGTYSSIVGVPTTNFTDAPDSFTDEIYRLIQEWKAKLASEEYQAAQRKLISDIRFNDNQSIPTLDFVTKGNLRMDGIKYRVTARGDILIDSTAEVPAFVLEQIPEHWEKFKQGIA